MSYLFKKFDIHVLEEVVGILREHEVVWWVDQGTLLGMIRDNDFLPWDHDVDIGAWSISSNKMDSLVKSLKDAFSYCYYDDLNSTLKIVFYDSSEKEYWWFDISFYLKEGGFAVKHWRIARGLSFVYAILFGFYEILLGGPIGRTKSFYKRFVKYPSEFIAVIFRRAGWGNELSCYLADVIKKYFSKTLVVSVEQKYFDAFEEITFFNVSVNIPARSVEYLEYKYGQNWRIPKKAWNYLVEDGAVK